MTDSQGGKHVCANSLVLLLVKGASWLEILVAVGIIALSIFVLANNWGPGFDASYFVGPCVLIILYGMILCTTSSLGLQGIRLLYTRIGVFSGHAVIAVYLTVFILVLGGEVLHYNCSFF